MASDLDRVIPPEIKNDEFYGALYFLARQFPIKTILEIGASSGEGSTEALVRGMSENPARPTLFTLEISKSRFERLSARYANHPSVRPFNMSSVGLDDFPSEAAVAEFHRNVESPLRANRLEKVLHWLRQDIAYIRDNDIPQNGIASIKAENRIDTFGLVLIDGSEFTGERELELILGADIIALDDIKTFKNYESHRRLLRESGYRICMMNGFLRNGYSVFMRVPPGQPA